MASTDAQLRVNNLFCEPMPVTKCDWAGSCPDVATTIVEMLSEDATSTMERRPMCGHHSDRFRHDHVCNFVVHEMEVTHV